MPDPDQNAEPYQVPVKPRRRRHGKPPGTQKEWYSKSEAAQYLGVAELTVTRYLDKGVLKAQRLPTTSHAHAPEGAPKRSSYDYGRLRINKGELDRYLESVDRRPSLPDQARSSTTAMQPSTGQAQAVEPRTQDEALLTLQEAALRLGVSWRTIYRYIKSGVLRLAGYFKCPDSYTRAHVYRSEVEKLLHGANAKSRTEE